MFRLERFFADKDVALLLGKDIPASKFNDDALGRVLDRLFDYGANKILTAIVLRAIQMFELDTTHVHYDTTSHSLYGDHDLYQHENHGEPFVITHGFSKALRPDLKQLIQSLLCVDHGIPIYSKCESGNESDKILKGKLLELIVKKMRELGQGDFAYIADSAAVTEKNLTLLNDPDKGCRFLSRLPATYKECSRVITHAVEADAWTDFGMIADDPAARYRDPAHYRGYETEVTLHQKPYRVAVEERPKYARGRPKADGQTDDTPYECYSGSQRGGSVESTRARRMLRAHHERSGLRSASTVRTRTVGCVQGPASGGTQLRLSQGRHDREQPVPQYAQAYRGIGADSGLGIDDLPADGKDHAPQSQPYRFQG
ncbi:MAG: IS1634 family transposase [Desulfomonile tiedjei]|uniref:IS1634 family transposase n=1 Tax=Desulfomonile tiedjei TaxID=2358 RepID=A0A9D6YYN1_9BACT|nr:IS1634 family transposase [Desulfomonile tiedjei]